MGSPKQADQETRADVAVLSEKRRVGEEIPVGPNALESEGEHNMVLGHKADAATEYKGYQALINRAVDVFGDELTASRWLSMPSADFNGEVPIYVAQDLGYDTSELKRFSSRSLYGSSMGYILELT